jgi:hypothetical protein
LFGGDSPPIVLGPMEVFFADDSDHDAIRPGMGTVFGLGGLFVPDVQRRPLADVIENILAEYGVPPDNELKWSHAALCA